MIVRHLFLTQTRTTTRTTQPKTTRQHNNHNNHNTPVNTGPRGNTRRLSMNASRTVVGTSKPQAQNTEVPPVSSHRFLQIGHSTAVAPTSPSPSSTNPTSSAPTGNVLRYLNAIIANTHSGSASPARYLRGQEPSTVTFKNLHRLQFVLQHRVLKLLDVTRQLLHD